MSGYPVPVECLWWRASLWPGLVTPVNPGVIWSLFRCPLYIATVQQFTRAYWSPGILGGTHGTRFHVLTKLQRKFSPIYLILYTSYREKKIIRIGAQLMHTVIKTIIKYNGGSKGIINLRLWFYMRNNQNESKKCCDSILYSVYIYCWCFTENYFFWYKLENN